MTKKTREDIDSKAGTSLATAGTAGLLPAVGADTSKYLGADLVWHTIAAGGDMAKATYDPDSDNKIAEAQLTLSYPTHSNASDHSVNDVGTHGTAGSGVHGAGTATIATTADITTHSGLTAAHGAGTILSTAAGTILIKTHSDLTAAHGVAGTIAAKADLATDTNLSALAQTAIIRTPVYVLASAGTVTGTVLTNIPNWTFACATGSTYKFTAFISSSASHTTGIAYGANYSGSNASIEAQIIGNVAATTAQAIQLNAFATKSAFFNKIANTGVAHFTGVIQTAGTAGNFTLAMCAGSAAATATIRANSIFEVIKVPQGAK